MTNEELEQYERYLDRFDRVVGAIRPGQYGRFKSRLVMKMTGEQYRRRVAEYRELGRQLSDRMRSGDTIDDTLVTALRAAEADLVLERSHFLPQPAR